MAESKMSRRGFLMTCTAFTAVPLVPEFVTKAAVSSPVSIWPILQSEYIRITTVGWVSAVECKEYEDLDWVPVPWIRPAH